MYILHRVAALSVIVWSALALQTPDSTSLAQPNEHQTFEASPEACDVPPPEAIRLKLIRGPSIPGAAMSSILDKAQRKIQAEVEEGRDRHLSPSDLPWIFSDSGLVITVAAFNWWTWGLLSDTIEGLRYCAFRKGNFEEIDIVGLFGISTPNIEGDVYMSLSTRYVAETVNRYSEGCLVPETSTTLWLVGSGRRIDSFDMSRILYKAQREVESKLTKGDRHLTPQEIPWIFASDGLVIKAELSGWSYRLLKNTIIGLRACPYQHSIFEEISVTAVVDPKGLDQHGSRFLSLTRRGEAKDGIDPPGPLPPDVEECTDPRTQLKLSYSLQRPIGAYAMQELLDGGQRAIQSRITVVGEEYVLTQRDLPWHYVTEGLIVVATQEGWTWGFLNRTIEAVRNCAFKKGQFNEVQIVDIQGPNVPPGTWYLSLKLLK
ncbi:MAG: hypothetical protein Q9219_000211 [cf. Caloplaca sp. 3 TL-2023]